jgi:translocation and assembly module TamB
VQREGKTWQVSDAQLAFGGARATLDGTLRDTIDARWSIRAPALDRLLPDAGGSLESNGSASGNWHRRTSSDSCMPRICATPAGSRDS